jgi:ssDNA-binding Zn-finger/Zn-ribbon topoisomerase 1
MAYREQSGLESTLFGIFVFCVIASGVANLFKFSFLGAAGIVGLILVGGSMSIAAVGSLSKWIAKQKRCPHGIRAGATRNCNACVAIEKSRQEEARRQQTERARKQEVKDQARKLQQSEIARLSKLWLSNAESYFRMTPRQFEDAIAELFRQLGYTVTQTPFVNDGGKDAIAIKNGRKHLIECKRYSEGRSIGRRDLQIFVAAMHDEGADCGFFINTGTFTRTALEYASKNSITLYDRSQLPSLISEAYPGKIDVSSARIMCEECGHVVEVTIGDRPVTVSCPGRHSVTNSITTAHFRVPLSTEAPHCDRCGSTMRLLHTHRGRFWGCSKYPKCRSTKPTD